MPTSDAQRRAAAKWDRIHMTTVSVKMTKDLARQFGAACRQLGVTRGEVLRAAVNKAIDQAKAEEQD